MIRLALFAAVIAAPAVALAEPPVPVQTAPVTSCQRDAGRLAIRPVLRNCGSGRTLLTINGRRLDDNAPAVIARPGPVVILPTPPESGLAGTIDLLFRDSDPQPIFDREPSRPEPRIMTDEPNVRPENHGGFQLIQKASATDDGPAVSSPAIGGQNRPERDAAFLRNRAKGQDDRLPLEVVGRVELLGAGSPSIKEIARSLNEVGHVEGYGVSTTNPGKLGKGQVVPIPLNRTAPPAPVKVEETGE